MQNGHPTDSSRIGTPTFTTRILYFPNEFRTGVVGDGGSREFSYTVDGVGFEDKTST